MKHKRKWITREQIREVIYDGDRLLRTRKSIGLPKEYITYTSYGDPVGEYIAAMSRSVGFTVEQAKCALKKHKEKPITKVREYHNADVFRGKIK